MRVRWLDDWIGLRKSTTRIPFRYGRASLVDCPQLVVRATCEIDGQAATGYAGDCLPPGWFDKTPGKSYARQLDEMIATIESARDAYRRRWNHEDEFFPVWLELQRGIPAWCDRAGIMPLLASFGLSLWERAVLDGACRASGLSFAQAVRSNRFGIDAGAVHERLRGRVPADWLPPRPLTRVAVRHTVGMGDPLEATEVPRAERLEDGRPQSLDESIDRCGVRYFKIKLSGDLAADLERLRRVVSVVESRRGTHYQVTLDGNEQFGDLETLGELIAQIRAEPALARLWEKTLAIEQPLPRGVALERSLEPLESLLGDTPVIIDESDGTLDSYERAIEMGYGGVSSKNCKGTMRSILNAGLVDWQRRECPEEPQIMTGEDLCSVGVIPVQADLCLAATLGLTHVERNGHHFHPGLAYLPQRSQREALEAHPDFYHRIGDTVSPWLREGGFAIESLQCVGFGFDWSPHEEDWSPPHDVSWEAWIGGDER